LNTDNSTQQFLLAHGWISSGHCVTSHAQMALTWRIELPGYTVNKKAVLPRIQHNIAKKYLLELGELYFQDIARPDRW